MANPIDITGQKFGKLTAIKYSGKSYPHRGRIWVCQCDCGNIREVTVGRLKSKSNPIRSCEKCCKRNMKERGINAMSDIHTRRKEKLHSIWSNMKQRCTNPNASNYSFYGGRGIRVCKEWENSYIEFKNWAVNNGYFDGLTIERIDVNKGYYPDNCRWITMREQGFNKRTSIYIEYDGKKIPVSKFVFDLGLSYNAVTHYLRSYKDPSK